MAVKEPATGQSLVIDKQWLWEKFAEMNARTGFVPDASVTVEQLRAMMLADGVRPEDNEASREMLHLRYPDDDPVWRPRNHERPEAQD